jgi:hypothetical protein
LNIRAERGIWVLPLMAPYSNTIDTKNVHSILSGLYIAMVSPVPIHETNEILIQVEKQRPSCMVSDIHVTNSDN